MLADGRIYITSEDGLTSVFAAGPTFQMVAENTVDEYTLSSVAVSNGQIFFGQTSISMRWEEIEIGVLSASAVGCQP